MNIFIDTSAFYAIMDAGDDFHSKASEIFSKIIEESGIRKNGSLISSNYIIVETLALIQNRLNINAARVFIDNILPIIKIYWIDKNIHDKAIDNLLCGQKSKISLVDFTSFKIMRNLYISKVFTFDRHFEQQGFTIMP